MERLKQLLRDYGYRFNGHDIIQIGIPGHTSDRIVGHARDAMSACDQMCPIINDERFTRRLVAYGLGQ